MYPSSGGSLEAEGAILSQFSLHLPFSERPENPFFELKCCNIHSVLLRLTLPMISGSIAPCLALTPSHGLQMPACMGLRCAEGRNQLSKAWELIPGNVNCFAKHTHSLKSVCSALDRCINSSISGFSKECTYKVIHCQNNNSDAWFDGNNTESHWLTLLSHTQKRAFLCRTIFLTEGENINNFYTDSS